MISIENKIDQSVFEGIAQFLVQLADLSFKTVHFLVLAVQLRSVHDNRTSEDCGYCGKEDYSFFFLLQLQIFLQLDVLFKDLGVTIELTGHLQHCMLHLLDFLLLSLQIDLPSLSQLHFSDPTICYLISQSILQPIVLFFVPSCLLLLHYDFIMHPFLLLLHLADPRRQYIIILLQIYQNLRVILIDINHRRCRHNRLDIRQLGSYSSHGCQAIIVIIDSSEPAILPIVICILLVTIKQNGIVNVIVVFVEHSGVILRDSVAVDDGGL